MDSSGSDGALAIVLHSHMPYVEGFGTYPFGEEWLFDAVLRSYLPVLEVADRLTMTVTPVLADQLEAPGVAERLETFGRKFRLGSCLLDAEETGEDLRAPCLAEAERYRRGLDQLGELGGPLAAFQKASADGRVSLMTSSATHAVLPLLATDAGRRLQLDAGIRSHQRRFGEPAGIWLPECAYAPGIEHAVAEHGLTHFCVDQSAHEAPTAALRPISTSAGPTAFPIDWEAISWLWSLDGYPSDPVHTDFHRESLRGVRAWSIGGDVRDPEAAAACARRQARDFLRAVRDRLAAHRETTGAPGLLTFAIDTELLGHWWWEGPEWLAEVVGAADDEDVELITLDEAAGRFELEAGREIAASSWGEHKDLSTWDSPAVADLAWGARRLELRLLREISERRLDAARAERAVRELLALQASDWAFLDKRRQAGDYPFTRVTTHARSLLDAIHCAHAPDARLRSLAPDLSLAPLFAP
ncbi:1,4-alpha-glucan branching protein [soil metagenome]